MRQLVQYGLDDSAGPVTEATSMPPSKKRKRVRSKGHGPSSVQHWDDPAHLPHLGRSELPYEDEDTVSEGESRELTHGEIWDDSALIDAWNSAEAEYAVSSDRCSRSVTTLTNQGISWKVKGLAETTHQKVPAVCLYVVRASTLSQVHARWYNVPCSTIREAEEAPTIDEEPANTTPHDFDTFVPTHDPSLSAAYEPQHPPHPVFKPEAPVTSGFSLPPAPTSTVSRDEAFNNALSAMYWSGYWTAVYHVSSSVDSSTCNPLMA